MNRTSPFVTPSSRNSLTSCSNVNIFESFSIFLAERRVETQSVENRSRSACFEVYHYNRRFDYAYGSAQRGAILS